MSERDLLANATPRPWRVKERRETTEISHGAYIAAENVGTPGSARTKEDAALIVAAVNEYEALLALEDVIRQQDRSFDSDAVPYALARLDAVREGNP